MLKDPREIADNAIGPDRDHMGVIVALVFFNELVFAVNAFWKCFNNNSWTGGKARHLTGTDKNQKTYVGKTFFHIMQFVKFFE